FLGELTMHGRPGGNDYVAASDYLNRAAQTFTLTPAAMKGGTIERTGMAPISYDNMMQLILLTSNYVGATVNALGDAIPTYLPVGPNATVTLGDHGSLAAFASYFRVQSGMTQAPTVIVDDSADLTPRQATVSNRDGVAGGIDGLAPGRLEWPVSDVAGYGMNV